MIINNCKDLGVKVILTPWVHCRPAGAELNMQMNMAFVYLSGKLAKGCFQFLAGLH
jgi:hypothetical protein